MKKWAILMLALMLANVFAMGDFSAELTGIKSGRGIIKDGALYLGNCNDPTKSQNNIMKIEIEYPDEECSGPMDVTYRYYDPYEQKFVDGKDSCVITSRDTCDFTVHFWYGGQITGIEKYQPWMIVIGKCRGSGLEYTAEVPLEVHHSPIQAESKYTQRISEIEEKLNNAKGLLADCGDCCSTLSSEYVRLQSDLDDYKNQLARCDFSDLTDKLSGLEGSVDQLISEANDKVNNCNNIVPDVDEVNDVVEDTTGGIADVADQANEVTDILEDTANETADKATKGCLSIVILLGMLGYLYKH